MTIPTIHLPEVLPCLVAFSGGADSRLLLELTLRALLERDGEAGRRQVLAAHLHHGIRGEEADRDLAFCERVCAELGVELICERADVPAMAAASGESLETAARRARYRFFSRILADRRIPVLMTAHHADDNLETVLERLLRGSGTRGMGGIPAIREVTDQGLGLYAVLYRPLLEWTRRDILAACAELGLDYVTDSTNQEDGCLRNRIRHTVIPALEAIAGEDTPQKSALRMSQAAAEDDGYLSHRAKQLVDTTLSPYRHAVRADDLRAHHAAIQKRVFMLLYRRALRDYRPDTDRDLFLTDTHLTALLRLTDKGLSESSLSLPGRLEARIRDGFLFVAPEQADGTILPHELSLPGAGVFRWGGSFTVTVESDSTILPPCPEGDCFASAVFPKDLPFPLLLRPRQTGDTILSHGMTKKLKKLLCDKGIPPHLRDLIPLVCLSDGEPLWYPRAAFRDGFPSPTEGGCVRITVRYTE